MAVDIPSLPPASEPGRPRPRPRPAAREEPEALSWGEALDRILARVPEVDTEVRCPTCQVVVPPVGGMLVDRYMRLGAHLVEFHAWELAITEIGVTLARRELLP